LNFGSVGLAAHNCIAVYVPGPNYLYLFTDDNSNAVGPIAEGAGGGSISNSQCTLTSGGTPATLSGPNLTVPFKFQHYFQERLWRQKDYLWLGAKLCRSSKRRGRSY
jgi:hypothetical protein